MSLTVTAGLGYTRALVQRTSTVDATHTLRGSGTFWGSLSPDHNPGRETDGEAEYMCITLWLIYIIYIFYIYILVPKRWGSLIGNFWLEWYCFEE